MTEKESQSKHKPKMIVEHSFTATRPTKPPKEVSSPSENSPSKEGEQKK